MFYHEDKSNQTEPKKVALPPMFFVGALAMMYLLHNSIPGFYFFRSRLSLILGGMMVCFGIAMVLWAVKTLKKAGTTHIPFEESTTLVQTGPFSYTRNPVYLGMVIILFGVFCFMGSSTPLMMVFIFGGIIEDKFIMAEEKMLEEKFGEQYLTYKKKASRWFPLLSEFAWEKTERAKNKEKSK